MKAYRRLLAGDFSGLEDESERSACEYDYERSLKLGNGKSVWKYVIADLNHDGTKELFIQLRPYPYDDPVAGNTIPASTATRTLFPFRVSTVSAGRAPCSLIKTAILSFRWTTRMTPSTMYC